MKTVYHGSTKKFDKFSYEFLGENGTNEGFGFYFTDNLNVARSYARKNNQPGFLYTVNFKGKKALSLEKKTMTRQQLKKLLVEIGDVYLDNWGEKKYTPNRLEIAINNEWNYNDNDIDLLMSIASAIGANYEKIANLVNRLFGYDSIIAPQTWGNQNIYIAIVESAYEIVKIQSLTDL